MIFLKLFSNLFVSLSLGFPVLQHDIQNWNDNQRQQCGEQKSADYHNGIRLHPLRADSL